MNRWRKLLVLWLLCVTMPLQAMAALRTHCAPGAPGAATAETPTSHAALTGMPHAMVSDGNAATLPSSHHDDALSATTSASAGDPSATPGMLAAHDAAGHTSCSACAACVACTALPPSMAIRLPDTGPSAAIPFLRTTAASAIVAVPERPPKSLAA
ncbi:hypothetical protein [Pandoraea sp. CB10b_02]|uniref:hypothetical protein n=1 Tax=Pandoraea sp. CB10b_02 TaxID=2014535 RepID=UPI00257D84B0|nr:hypothetical protein [Pandoraea sp. CB10b_02]